MTEAPVPAAAVQIAAQAVTRGWGAMRVPTDDVIAHTAVAALGRAGWLHAPAEVAAREAALLAALGAGSNEDPVSAASFVREAADAFATRITTLEAEVAALRAVADESYALYWCVKDSTDPRAKTAASRLGRALVALDALPVRDAAPAPPQGEDVERLRNASVGLLDVAESERDEALCSDRELAARIHLHEALGAFIRR